jgi:uncharacterized protein YbjT (DUF2867 family)
MRIVLTGATGMIGQGALLACLKDPRVAEVIVVGRRPLGTSHEKLRELLRPDLSDWSGVDLSGVHAMLWCMGVSAGGMEEAEYRRITYDTVVAGARALLAASPQAAIVYVSGQGTGGKAMWARVKGETEAALLALSPRAHMFRPGLIQPMDGIRSGTRAYRIAYAVLPWLWPLLRWLAPNSMTDTQRLGSAMLNAVARPGAAQVLEPAAINALSAAPA